MPYLRLVQPNINYARGNILEKVNTLAASAGPIPGSSFEFVIYDACQPLVGYP